MIAIFPSYFIQVCRYASPKNLILRLFEWPLAPYLLEPGSKLVVLGMAIPPLIGNPYNGYINPYYWVDDHPLLYGNNGSLDPSTLHLTRVTFAHPRPPHGSFADSHLIIITQVASTLVTRGLVRPENQLSQGEKNSLYWG